MENLDFFLKNTNIDPSAVRLSREDPSNFIHFVQVNNKYFDNFVKNFPQLTDRDGDIYCLFKRADS